MADWLIFSTLHQNLTCILHFWLRSTTTAYFPGQLSWLLHCLTCQCCLWAAHGIRQNKLSSPITATWETTISGRWFIYRNRLMQQVLFLLSSKNASQMDFMFLKCDYYSECIVYKRSCIDCRLVTIDHHDYLERALFSNADCSYMSWIGHLKSNRCQKVKVFQWLYIGEWEAGQQADLENSRKNTPIRAMLSFTKFFVGGLTQRCNPSIHAVFFFCL